MVRRIKNKNAPDANVKPTTNPAYDQMAAVDIPASRPSTAPRRTIGVIKPRN